MSTTSGPCVVAPGRSTRGFTVPDGGAAIEFTILEVVELEQRPRALAHALLQPPHLDVDSVAEGQGLRRHRRRIPSDD